MQCDTICIDYIIVTVLMSLVIITAAFDPVTFTCELITGYQDMTQIDVTDHFLTTLLIG